MEGSSRERLSLASSKCHPSAGAPHSPRSATIANNEVSEDDWDLGPGPSSSVVAPPRRAGDLRSDGESESEDWDLEDDWEFDASEDKRTGSDEAEAASGDFVYPLLGEAAHQREHSEQDGADGGGSSKVPTCPPCSPAQTRKRGIQCKHTKAYAIYKLTSPIGKGYVGQAQCLVCRFARYKWGQSHNGTAPIAMAVAKYGWKNMGKEVLVQGLHEDEMDAEEVKQIAEHNTMAPNGYNIQEGGRRHSGYKRSSGPPVKGPRSEATKSRISQGFAERRTSILEGMEDKEEAQRVSACLERDRETQKRYRAQKDEASKEEWAAIAKANRAATWERKREEKWEAMGWTEEQKVKGRKKAEQQKRSREECERKNPGKRAAESKAYMDVHRKKWNDARPRLTGNLRANS